MHEATPDYVIDIQTLQRDTLMNMTAAFTAAGAAKWDMFLR